MKKKQVKIYLDSADHKALKIKAVKDDIKGGVSAVIGRLVEKYLNGKTKI